MATSLNDFLHDELAKARVSEVVEAGLLDPVALVEKHLFDGRVHVRRNASLALGLIGRLSIDNAHWVFVATKDSDVNVRAQTTEALVSLGLPVAQSFDALLNRLADPDASVAERAYEALERLVAEHKEDMASLLVAHLSDLRPKAALTCQQLCARISSEVAGPLVSACGGDDLGLATLAKATLATLGTSVQGALIAGLTSRRGRFRLVALLDALPPAAGADREALSEHAKSEVDPDLVKVAERLLAKPQPQGASAPLSFPSDDFATVLCDDKALKAFAAAPQDRASLLAGLKDARPVLRANCAALLGRLISDEQSVRGVSSLARDSAPEVRLAAASALGPLGGAEALAVCLSDRDAAIVAAARAGVQALPPEAVPALIVSASTSTQEVVDRVIDALSMAGKGTLKGLHIALESSATIPARRLAALALSRSIPEPLALKALTLGLSDESARVQTACALGLRPLGTEAPEGLRAALRDTFEAATDDLLLRACSRTLDAFDGKVPPPLALEPLALPSDAFASERLDEAALKTLSKGADIALLDELLLDGRPLVRLNALGLLALLGDTASEAIEGIVLCLKDADNAVRVAAAEALGRLAMDAARVAPALVHARPGASPDLLRAIDQAFDAYGASAVDPLISLMGARATINEDALEVLATLGQPAAKALVGLLSHDALTLRVAAARGLGAFGERASKATRKAISDAFEAAQEPALLRACSAALDAIDGTLPPPTVIEERALPMEGFDVELLDDAQIKKAAAKMDAARLGELLFDGRTPCRVNAARALGHLGKGAQVFVGALMVALKDSEPVVREASAQALGRLTFEPEVVVAGLALAAIAEGAEAVSLAALEALDAFGTAAVAPCIALLAEDGLRAGSVGLIASRHPKRFVTPLCQALEGDESLRVQENAALALTQLGDAAAAAEKTLRAMAARSDVPLKCTVIRALGETAKPSEALMSALEELALVDERGSVEDAVAQALSALRRRA